MSALEEKLNQNANIINFRNALSTFLSSVIEDTSQWNDIAAFVDQNLSADERDSLELMIKHGIVTQSPLLSKIAGLILTFNSLSLRVDASTLEINYIRDAKARIVSKMKEELIVIGQKAEVKLFIARLPAAYNALNLNGYNNSELNFESLNENDMYLIYTYCRSPFNWRISALKPIIRKLHNIPDYFTDETSHLTKVIAQFKDACAYLRFEMEQPTKPNRFDLE